MKTLEKLELKKKYLIQLNSLNVGKWADYFPEIEFKKETSIFEELNLQINKSATSTLKNLPTQKTSLQENLNYSSGDHFSEDSADHFSEDSADHSSVDSVDHVAGNLVLDSFMKAKDKDKFIEAILNLTKDLTVAKIGNLWLSLSHLRKLKPCTIESNERSYWLSSEVKIILAFYFIQKFNQNNFFLKKK